MGCKPGARRAAAAAIMFSTLLSSAGAQRKQRDVSVSDRDITILVTAHPHNERTREAALKLKGDDFAVREEKRPQQIISVKSSSEAPPILALLIQDDLVSRVNNEIKGIKEFIRRLPEGSRVMTAYITSGTLQVAQDFTTDRERAANSLRIVHGSSSSSPYNPYVEVVEALRRFDSQPAGRRMILMISDGLDTSHGFRSSSPTLSVDLDRAIREAERRGVAVFSFYAPTVGATSASRMAANFGQGSLIRLADETGGEAFFSGNDFVSFDPYFKEFDGLLGLQWLITYRSSTVGTGFRHIEVTTEQDIHLHHQDGYNWR
ncbi:MAG: VWA domain-containing protein [Acidobacteriota bacterium]